MRALNLTAVLVGPAAVGGAVLWARTAQGPDRVVEAVRIVAPFLAATGVLGGLIGVRARRVRRAAGCLTALAGVAASTAVWEPAGRSFLQLFCCEISVWALLGSLVAPALALGYRSCGALVWLGVVGAGCATPWLVGNAPTILAPWVLDWNPIARILGVALGLDVLHQPGLYHVVGGAYYRNPEGVDGVLVPAMAGVVSLLVAGVIAWRRPAPEVSP